MLGASTVVAWVMVVGLVAGLVPAILATPAEPPEPSAIVLLVLTGLCNVTGLVFVYRGLRVGPVGIVAPITSTEGAIAALIAVLFGEALGLPAAVTLAMIAIGVVIAAIPAGGPDLTGEQIPVAGPLAIGDPVAVPALDDGPVRPQRPRLAAVYGVAAASLFGVGLFSAATAVGLGIPVIWVAMSARFVGLFGVALPLLARRRLRLTRAAAPLVVTAGLAEIIGFVLYALGAQSSIGVAAVLSSQFAVIAGVAAFFLFGERLGRLQVAGVALVVVGVAALTLITV